MAPIDRREFLKANAALGALALIVPGNPPATTAPVRVVGLKVDYLECPLGLDNPRPLFSWQLESNERGIQQSAYRIIVAGSEARVREGHGDLWDTGKVISQSCFGIEYHGKTLQPRQRCWWQVRLWNQLGRPTQPSPVGWWEMGLLSPNEWAAGWLMSEDSVAKADRETLLNWIWGSTLDDQRARKFRYVFHLPTGAQDGELYLLAKNVTSEVVNEVWLDGKRLGTEIPLDNLARELIPVGALNPGTHCLAINVKVESFVAEPMPEALGAPPPSFGIAAFLRLNDSVGAATRQVSGQGWKTSVSSDPNWFECHHDDAIWDTVSVTPVEDNPLPEAVVHLRRNFAVTKVVKAARLYISALGFYEARLNGGKIGDAFLDPAPSEIRKHVFYRTYDVTGQVQSGPNVLGVTVAGGWYRYFGGSGPPKVIAQLEIVHTDGSRQSVVTDESWRVVRSAILKSEPTWGEMTDGRLERNGWDDAGLDDRHWEYARAASPRVGALIGDSAPSVRVTRVLTAQSILNPFPGTYVFDFGQSFVGWCRLKVNGPAGTRVDLQFAEELAPSGVIDQFSYLGTHAIDTYVLRGDVREETFEPKFTWHSARYVQVSGLRSPPSRDSLLGIVVNSALTITGDFRADNPLIERIWRNTMRSQTSTFQGTPFTSADRPTEIGSMGDAREFWDAAAFNMDVAAFASRQMQNVRDAQQPNGALPFAAPNVFNEREATPAYSDGSIILPWMTWWRYGDTGIIEQNWKAMNRYVQYALDNNLNYLWQNKLGDDFGDWVAVDNDDWYHPSEPPTTPHDLIATAYWAHSTNLLAEMAAASQREADASRLRTIWRRIRDQFASAFISGDGRVGNGSQTSYVLALKFGLVPEPLKAAAASHLVADIRARGGALSTGHASTEFILDVLADAGYPDVLYDLLLRTAYPSWGYMIERGATSWWERWDGALDHHHNEASRNYPGFGGICGFFFRRIAGIDAAEPGFKAILVRPTLDPLARFESAGADYDSIVGRISTDWHRQDDGGFSLSVLIPANSRATIFVPARYGARITEGGVDLSRRGSKGVRLVDRRRHEAVVEVTSGRFEFLAEG